jgi:hypothetical protein
MLGNLCMPGDNMDNRTGNDRRKATPFGERGPWLTKGKMGGLIFTERRTLTDRRHAGQYAETLS